MNDATLRGRIFIVGVPRSGTTLLQALLAGHEQVTSFTESHFFSSHYNCVPLLGALLTADPSVRVARFLEENTCQSRRVYEGFQHKLPATIRLPALRALHSHTVARCLVEMLDEFGISRGAPVWLEKTPRHLQFLPLIERATNDGIPTRFVHVIRDGLATVTSLYRASTSWERAYSLEECVQRWNQDMARTVANLASPSHCVVRYEALVDDPDSVLVPLLQTLELPRQGDLIPRISDEAALIIKEEETWKAGVTAGMNRAPVATEALKESEQVRVVAALRQDLFELAAHRALGKAMDAAHGGKEANSIKGV
ncbi:MAG: sulfotransferase [Pseudomonadota bacterium]